ncbi:hypothetical protein RRG08_055291 [Elysia crispata]|uniref:Uncharacterized protein n=1 Tax=Elysia crispata TaxID=231223 RepID=A0AAE0YUT8_9GAST|nr:hypothetical protein RRG08_055291 [Elysia crispata]
MARRDAGTKEYLVESLRCTKNYEGQSYDMWLNTFKHTDDKNPDLKDQYEEMEQNVTSVWQFIRLARRSWQETKVWMVTFWCTRIVETSN